jgi:hypothetical protein
MCCVAHIINLIVKDGINVMDKGIKRVGDSVGFLVPHQKDMNTLKV